MPRAGPGPCKRGSESAGDPGAPRPAPVCCPQSSVVLTRPWAGRVRARAGPAASGGAGPATPWPPSRAPTACPHPRLLLVGASGVVGVLRGCRRLTRVRGPCRTAFRVWALCCPRGRALGVAAARGGSSRRVPVCLSPPPPGTPTWRPWSEASAVCSESSSPTVTGPRCVVGGGGGAPSADPAHGPSWRRRGVALGPEVWKRPQTGLCRRQSCARRSRACEGSAGWGEAGRARGPGCPHRLQPGATRAREADRPRQGEPAPGWRPGWGVAAG